MGHPWHPEALGRAVVEHCIQALPNEGCGLLALDGARIAKIYPTGNDRASPTGYTIPPQDHWEALSDAESHGYALGGVFHSHPTGAPTPSSTDITEALDPTWIYLIVGFHPDPELRAWSIVSGEAREITIRD